MNLEIKFLGMNVPDGLKSHLEQSKMHLVAKQTTSNCLPEELRHLANLLNADKTSKIFSDFVSKMYSWRSVLFSKKVTFVRYKSTKS